MKKVKFLCGVVFSTVFNLAFADENNCKDLTQINTPDIQMVGKFEESKNERKYFYYVKNKTNENIELIILGEGKTSDKIQIFEDNIATKIISPSLWEGSQVYEDEGFYSKIFWSYESDSAQDVDFLLGVELSKLKGIKGIYSDGEPAKAADFLKMQYTIYLSSGNCFFGKVLF